MVYVDSESRADLTEFESELISNQVRVLAVILVQDESIDISKSQQDFTLGNARLSIHNFMRKKSMLESAKTRNNFGSEDNLDSQAPSGKFIVTPKTWHIRKAVLDDEYSYDFGTERSVRQFKSQNTDGAYLKRRQGKCHDIIQDFVKRKGNKCRCF